jgi:LPS O-antigen subunit length determinant protein (WzzB/FepE family)
MDKNENYTSPQQTEEEGLDIMALLRNLWDGRKTVLICLGIFVALGLVAALTMKRTYTVKTVMVPQINSRQNSSLGSLAALAGIDLGMQTTASDLSPLVYPEIVNSVPYRLELMHTPLHYKKVDHPISMFDYILGGYDKPSVFAYIKRYTIGLPGLIISQFASKPQEIVLPKDGSGSADTTEKPIVITVNEQKMLEVFGKIVTLDVNKKEGYLTLIVNGTEPIQTAELALKAQKLLQDEVTRHRIEKSEKELMYIEARYQEVKKENDMYQEQLAVIKDRTKNVTNSRDEIERDRIQAKYNVSNAIFNEMAKQLEQAKMQVKRDTPAYAIIQPVTIPMKPSNSRAKTLIVWTFFGFILGCGIVLGKGYWKNLKNKFNDNVNDNDN